jgi:uncharacterized protein with von Willebrand factor type A (vWA) domain
MTTTINYQQIFEDEVDSVTKDLMNFSTQYSELSPESQRFIEELVDLGYRRAMEDALDPEVLAETMELSGEMGTQLYNFSNMIQSFLAKNNDTEN